MVTKHKAKSTKKRLKCNRKRFGIVVSSFNDFATKRLLNACLEELRLSGVKKRNIDAVICLGAVIRGETPHFEYVARSTADGIMQAGLTTQKPVIFGVLTTDTINQANARSKIKGYNKGREAAKAAVEMTHIIDHLK